MIKNPEESLRDYFLKKKSLPAYSIYTNEIMKDVYKIKKEALTKVFGANFYPRDKVFYTKEETIDYIKRIVLKEFYYIKSKIITPHFNCEHFLKKVDAFFNSEDVEKLLAEKECDFSGFLYVMDYSIDFEEGPYNINSLMNYFCIPFRGQFLVHGIYRESTVFDLEILQEKLKAIILHYSPFNKKELYEFIELYEYLVTYTVTK